MIEKVISKCKEEIEWAQTNIDEMNLDGNPHNYQDADRVWLPCWLMAHEGILALIQGETCPAQE